MVRIPSRHPMRMFDVAAAPLTLIDADRTVRYGGLQFDAGQVLSEEQMAQSVPVDSYNFV